MGLGGCAGWGKYGQGRYTKWCEIGYLKILLQEVEVIDKVAFMRLIDRDQYS